MTYEPFSLRTRKQVEAMGALAYRQHADNYNSPRWGLGACSLLDPTERSLWVESWYKTSQVNRDRSE